MAYILNTQGQYGLHRLLRADGSITSSVAAQLILPVQPSRAMLSIVNTSASNMRLEHGPARFRAVLTGGAVSSFVTLNGGFNYTVAPSVQLVGGGSAAVANASFLGIGQWNMKPPTTPATAHATVSGGVVSLVLDSGGSGYVNPPEVIITNDPTDPFGCADPYNGGAGSGVLLFANGANEYTNGTACFTESVAISGTAGATFYVGYMT